MNSSSHISSPCEGKSFLRAYKFRLFWYVGATLIVLGASLLSAAPFVASLLVLGTLNYLMQSIPASAVTIITFTLLNGHVPKKIFGLELKWVSRLIIAIGILVVAWGIYRSNVGCGGLGINITYWGAELTLLSRESAYWEGRRKRRSNHT